MVSVLSPRIQTLLLIPTLLVLCPLASGLLVARWVLDHQLPWLLSTWEEGGRGKELGALSLPGKDSVPRDAQPTAIGSIRGPGSTWECGKENV